MATTKRRASTRSSSTKRRTTATAKASRSASTASRSRKSQANPYLAPALATGAVAAIAAAAAGVWFFRKSDKSLSETTESLSGRIKDGIYEARDKARQGARSFKDKAAIFFADEPASQTEIAKDAMARKRSGRKTSRPADDTIEAELKTGAISY